MMQRLDMFRSNGRQGRATAALLALLVTVTWAGSAVAAEQTPGAQRLAVIEGILADNAGNPAALQDAIANVFGNVQGDQAIARAQQILNALPSELSDAQWAAIKAAIGAKASALISAGASQAINTELAAKESALRKSQLQASVVTEEDGNAERKSSARGAPSAPPQDQVICASASCE